MICWIVQSSVREKNITLVLSGHIRPAAITTDEGSVLNGECGLGVFHLVIFPIGISTPHRSEVTHYGLHLHNLPALTLSVHHAKWDVQFKCTFRQFYPKTDPWEHSGAASCIWHPLRCLPYLSQSCLKGISLCKCRIPITFSQIGNSDTAFVLITAN